MNFLDILLAIPMCVYLWKGWRKGLIYEIATLVGLVAGIWAAVHLSCHMADWLNLGEKSVLMSFFLTFVIVVVLAHFLGKCIEGLLKLVKVSMLNNLLGAFASMLTCVCILSVLIFYVEVIDRHELLLTSEAKTESVLYRPVSKVGNATIGKVKTLVHDYRESQANKKIKDCKAEK